MSVARTMRFLKPIGFSNSARFLKPIAFSSNFENEFGFQFPGEIFPEPALTN